MDNRILLAAEELEALAQTLRSVSSAGEKTPSCPMTLTEWQDWVDQVQTDVLVLKQKVAALESGPPSPAIMAPSMTPTQEAPSDAEPCPICQLPQKSGPHRHPMAPAPEPDSPPECTDPATPSSSQQPGDPTEADPSSAVLCSACAARLRVLLGW
jgi:uncharacterized membrane protein